MDYAETQAAAARTAEGATVQVRQITQQMAESNSPELFLDRLVWEIARRKVWADVTAIFAAIDAASDMPREETLRSTITVRLIAMASQTAETESHRAERVIWSHVATAIGL